MTCRSHRGHEREASSGGDERDGRGGEKSEALTRVRAEVAGDVHTRRVFLMSLHCIACCTLL